MILFLLELVGSSNDVMATRPADQRFSACTVVSFTKIPAALKHLTFHALDLRSPLDGDLSLFFNWAGEWVVGQNGCSPCDLRDLKRRYVRERPETSDNN